MSELSNKYREIMNELDEKITDKKQLDFVKSKLSEISIIFVDIIDRMSEIVEDKVFDIEKGQKNIESRLTKIQNVIDSIESDIYEENVETEIVCPYCNSEFLADIGDEEENEIECPDCHNIIELDMTSDNSADDFKTCTGGCQCSGSCPNKKLNNEDDDM